MKTLKMILVLVFCFGGIKMSFGQSDTSWTKTFGGIRYDCASSVKQTTDGGYIITGVTCTLEAGLDDCDVYLIKTNADGDTLWTKTFGGSNLDEGFSVQQTTDGGYIVTGVTASFGASKGHVWLLKTNTLGDLLWTKTFGGSDGEGGYSVQQTSDSGYIVTGFTLSFGAGNKDVYLIKTNADGDTLWTKTFGGSDYDEGYSVQQTSDGGYIVTGGTKCYGAVSGDVLLIKTNAAGGTLWTKTFGGNRWEIGYSVQQTSDGGYIIVGETQSIDYDYDIGLIKTNADGDTIWTKTYGGSKFDEGYSVQQTTDGGYIVTGGTRSYGVGGYDLWLIKTNGSGDVMWTKTYGGSNHEYGKSVHQTIDGEYIIAGYTSSFGAGDRDVWLIKTIFNPKSINNGIRTKIQTSYGLIQNYPNPFNPSTTIEFTLPKAELVKLQVYNTLGQIVGNLVEDKLQAGSHEFEFNASHLPSGVYFYRLQAGEYVDVKKMILLK